MTESIKSYNLIDELLFVFMLILSTNPITPVFFPDNDLFSEPAWYFIYLYVFFVAYKRNIKIKVDIFIFLVIIICAISIIWSDQQLITFKKSIALLCSTFVILYFLSIFKDKQLLKLISISFGFIVVMNIIFIILFPYNVYDSFNDPTALRGIYTTKNYLSKLMLLSIISIYFYFKVCKKNILKKPLWLILLLSSFVLLILAKSAMVLIALIIISMLIIVINLIPQNRDLRIFYYCIFVVLSIIILYLLVGNFDSILGIFGKNTEFSGRFVIWHYVLEAIKNSPLVGYGYSAFWGGVGTPSGNLVRIIGWNVPSAHNGFLDIWLSIGLIGLLLILTSIISVFNRLIKFMNNNDFYQFLFIILFYLLIINSTETSLLLSNNIYWIFFVMLVTCSKKNERKGDF
jgi:exopolysaccharide production protein ExoQ